MTLGSLTFNLYSDSTYHWECYSAIITSPCKSGRIAFCALSPPFLGPFISGDTAVSHEVVCECGHSFVLRCSHFGRLLHLKGYESSLLSLRITLNPAFRGVSANNLECVQIVCVPPCVCVCGNTRRSSREGGQGPLSQQRWRGGIAPSLLWGNMTWGPPANSHRITCDRGEPPPHKSPPLLLFFLPLSSPRLLNMQRPPCEIKINHIFTVWLHCHFPKKSIWIQTLN